MAVSWAETGQVHSPSKELAVQPPAVKHETPPIILPDGAQPLLPRWLLGDERGKVGSPTPGSSFKWVPH